MLHPFADYVAVLALQTINTASYLKLLAPIEVIHQSAGIPHSLRNCSCELATNGFGWGKSKVMIGHVYVEHHECNESNSEGLRVDVTLFPGSTFRS